MSNTKLYWWGSESVAVFAGDTPDLFKKDWQQITITRLEKSEEFSAPTATDTLLVDIVVKT